ncbi:MAG: hypothetical protein LBO00_08260 [Zoogloeaceae bacterium]|jgi:hypothetical protein|nr:hypothetical protein [Zoogloeaceae bacterium]
MSAGGGEAPANVAGRCEAAGGRDYQDGFETRPYDNNAAFGLRLAACGLRLAACGLRITMESMVIVKLFYTFSRKIGRDMMEGGWQILHDGKRIYNNNFHIHGKSRRTVCESTTCALPLYLQGFNHQARDTFCIE